MRNHIKREVEGLMRLDTNFRNNDKALVLQVWRNHGLELSPEQIERFKMAPSVDSILRRRRELSSKYPPTKEVLEQRYKHYKSHIEEFSKQSFIVRLLKRKGI